MPSPAGPNRTLPTSLWDLSLRVATAARKVAVSDPGWESRLYNYTVSASHWGLGAAGGALLFPSAL